MSLEKATAIRILKSRVIISSPGKFAVKVNSCNPYEGKFICNFNAMNSFQFSKAKALVAEGKLDDACNVNLSASLLPGMYIPSKGEMVHVTVGYVTTKSGEQALLVTGVNAIPVSEAVKADWDFDAIETEEPALDDIVGEKDAE